MARFAIRLLALLGVTALVILTPTVAGAVGGRTITVAMTGAQEVPGPGDPDGTGTATFAINPGLKSVCYTLTAQNIEPAVSAHIHRAPVGVAGGVVVPLVPPTSGSSTACAEVDRRLAAELIGHPERFYVNVHNVPFPDGAIRGQLG
jgi:hypothetical protein